MISFQGELLVRHAVRGHQPVVRAGHRLRRPLLPARLLQAAGEERLRIPGEALRPQGQVTKSSFARSLIWLARKRPSHSNRFSEYTRAFSY